MPHWRGVTLDDSNICSIVGAALYENACSIVKRLIHWSQVHPGPCHLAWHVAATAHRDPLAARVAGSPRAHGPGVARTPERWIPLAGALIHAPFSSSGPADAAALGRPHRVALEGLGHAAPEQTRPPDGPSSEASPDLVGGRGGTPASVIDLVEERQLLRLVEVRGGHTQQSHLDASQLRPGQLQCSLEEDLGLVGRLGQRALA